MISAAVIEFKANCRILSFNDQQYCVVLLRIGWLRVKIGLGLTGKLHLAWVGAWLVHVVAHGCMVVGHSGHIDLKKQNNTNYTAL